MLLSQIKIFWRGLKFISSVGSILTGVATGASFFYWRFNMHYDSAYQQANDGINCHIVNDPYLNEYYHDNVNQIVFNASFLPGLTLLTFSIFLEYAAKEIGRNDNFKSKLFALMFLPGAAALCNYVAFETVDDAILPLARLIGCDDGINLDGKVESFIKLYS